MLKADDYAVPEAKLWGWMGNSNVKQPKPVVETGRMGNPVLQWLVDHLEYARNYKAEQDRIKAFLHDPEAKHGFSRSECVKMGITRYRGKPCKNCGSQVRYANNSACVHCNNTRNRSAEEIARRRERERS